MSNITFDWILISLIFTFCIYALPMMIYRYAVKKEPIEPKKAKTIVIIYGIIVFFAITAISGQPYSGGAVLLWSYINYSILTAKSKYPDTQSKQTLKDASAELSAQQNNFVQSAAPQPAVSPQQENASVTAKSIMTEQNLAQNSQTEIERPEINESAETASIEYTDAPVYSINFCHKCGAKLQQDAQFCIQCGTRSLK